MAVNCLPETCYNCGLDCLVFFQFSKYGGIFWLPLKIGHLRFWRVFRAEDFRERMTCLILLDWLWFLRLLFAFSTSWLVFCRRLLLPHIPLEFLHVVLVVGGCTGIKCRLYGSLQRYDQPSPTRSY